MSSNTSYLQELLKPLDSSVSLDKLLNSIIPWLTFAAAVADEQISANEELKREVSKALDKEQGYKKAIEDLSQQLENSERTIQYQAEKLKEQDKARPIPLSPKMVRRERPKTYNEIEAEKKKPSPVAIALATRIMEPIISGPFLRPSSPTYKDDVHELRNRVDMARDPMTCAHLYIEWLSEMLDSEIKAIQEQAAEDLTAYQQVIQDAYDPIRQELESTYGRDQMEKSHAWFYEMESLYNRQNNILHADFAKVEKDLGEKLSEKIPPTYSKTSSPPPPASVEQEATPAILDEVCFRSEAIALILDFATFKESIFHPHIQKRIDRMREFVNKLDERR
jgi:hypothetical protein